MTLIEELRCDEKIQEALVKVEELTSRLSAKPKDKQLETKLKLLEIATEIRQELFERAVEEEEVKG